MSLKEDLQNVRDGASERMSAEALNIMTSETQRLKKSGLVDHSLKAGDQAPAFELPNAKGELVSLNDLLAIEPVVLSFYRGGW